MTQDTYFQFTITKMEKKMENFLPITKLGMLTLKVVILTERKKDL
jgi:hypothetical protein